MNSLTKKEIAFLKRMNTPAKVQDFLNKLKFNFEKEGETLKSPLLTLRKKNAHCMEGGLLGAYILSLHGHTPYLIHLKTTKNDYDHVIAPFKINGLWGALSKTNHAALRYREPVYKNIRELAMSYFHEYFLNDGKKTLREYSWLFNLNTLKRGWMFREDDLWDVDKELDKIKRYKIMPESAEKRLRKADKIERDAGRVVEYKK